MSNYILTYFFTGVIFTFLIDLLIGYLCNLNKPSFAHNMKWDNHQRILCVILWPFAMVWFFVAFFKSWFN